MGLLFLKQLKTGTAYAETSFWQDSDSDTNSAPMLTIQDAQHYATTLVQYVAH